MTISSTKRQRRKIFRSLPVISKLGSLSHSSMEIHLLSFSILPWNPFIMSSLSPSPSFFFLRLFYLNFYSCLLFFSVTFNYLLPFFSNLFFSFPLCPFSFSLLSCLLIFSPLLLIPQFPLLSPYLPSSPKFFLPLFPSSLFSCPLSSP